MWTHAEEERHRAPRGVQAVVALSEHDRLRTVDDIGGDFEPSVGREAVHEHCRRIGEGHHVGVDGVALELLDPPLLVVLLAHRHPRVGVHRMGSGDGLGGAGGLLDGCCAQQTEALEFRDRCVEAVRAGEPDVHAQHRGDLRERTSDVVEVADVCHGLAGERPETLLHRERVGERLERVRVVGQHVDHGDVDDCSHPGHGQVVEDPCRDDGVVALQDPGDVLHGLAGVEPDLLATGVDGVPTQLEHGHLHGVPGAVRGLFEDEGDALAGEWPIERDDRLFGQRQDLAHLVGGEIGDVEEMSGGGTHGVAPRSASARASASTISARPRRSRCR